jgi:hypothetical protein
MYLWPTERLLAPDLVYAQAVMECGHRSFEEDLDTLLRDRQKTGPLQAPSIKWLAERIPGWSYEHVRRMSIGERTRSSDFIEAVAAALGVAPDYFLEYRIWRVEVAMKENPEIADECYGLLMSLLDREKAPAKKRGKR